MGLFIFPLDSNGIPLDLWTSPSHLSCQVVSTVGDHGFRDRLCRLRISSERLCRNNWAVGVRNRGSEYIRKSRFDLAIIQLTPL